MWFLKWGLCMGTNKRPGATQLGWHKFGINGLLGALAPAVALDKNLFTVHFTVYMSKVS